MNSKQSRNLFPKRCVVVILHLLFEREFELRVCCVVLALHLKVLAPKEAELTRGGGFNSSDQRLRGWRVIERETAALEGRRAVVVRGGFVCGEAANL